MKHQPFSLIVFLGVLVGALIGTLVVPGLGTFVGVLVGGAVGLVVKHRRAQAKAVPPAEPPRM